MFKKFLLLTSIFAFTLTTSDVFAVPAKGDYMVKVGISDSNFSNYYFQKTSVTSTDSFRIYDKDKKSLIGDFSADENIQIEIKNNLFRVFQDSTEFAKNLKGPIVIESDYGYVSVSNLKRAGKPAFYRGVLEITKVPKKDNLFNVINVLDLNSYLKGVVPNEMPVRFGLEALKAQTIMARNYVLRPRENNYHNFDVCDSVACQVYFGANTEHSLSDEAVEETENIVAMANGELILGLYSSTAGGYTESYENAFSTDINNVKVFPGISKSYLKGKPDNKKTPVLDNEKNAREFYTSTPETFDNNSPYFRWTREWSQDELEKVLKNNLVKFSSSGFIKPKIVNINDFGKLKDIKVQKRGVSGKVMSIDIITDKGTFNVQKELVIRRVFTKSGKALPSANIVFDFEKDKTKNTNKIIVYGGGFGHGVGMSQFGAGYMASKGFSYDEILQHYYSNISINTIPVVLSNETGKDTAKQTFYTDKKFLNLYIDNKLQFTKLIIVINGQELRAEIVPQFFNPEKFDLSKYVKKGKNDITFMLPYSDLHKKPVKLYLELKEAEK